MSITAITIENFKGIKEPVRVELKPLTLLFGPNSAGKSTIVQALHYAREIFERHNLDPDQTLLGGDAIDLGGFQSIVHGHDLSLPVTLRFDLDLTDEDLPGYLSDALEPEEGLWPLMGVKAGWVELTIRWSRLNEKPLITAYETGLDCHPVARISCSEDGKQIYISFLNFDHPMYVDDPSLPWEEQASHLEEVVQQGLRLAGKTSRNGNDVFLPLALERSVLPAWGHELGFQEEEGPVGDIEQFRFYRNQAIGLLSSSIVGPGELVRDALRRFCYIGPLREVPKRNHKPANSPEASRWSNGLAAYDTLFFSDEAFITKVNGWLTQDDRLATGYSVEVKKYRELENNHPLMLAMLQGRILDDDMDLRKQLLSLPILRRLLIRDEARDIELAPQDIGVGISQVLPVVVAALQRKTGFVAIEQPELHIHPALQVALGDLFIEQIRERDDLVFLLETHSEHLLLRFLRRIRETGEGEVEKNKKLVPDELAVYFMEQGGDGLVCHRINVDEDGDFLDRWPHGFFAERAGELF